MLSRLPRFSIMNTEDSTRFFRLYRIPLGLATRFAPRSSAASQKKQRVYWWVILGGVWRRGLEKEGRDLRIDSLLARKVASDLLPAALQ
jgi:hypothetical protein